MHQIDIASAAKSLPNNQKLSLVAKVVITRKTALVKLTLISKSKPHPQFGSDRGWSISDDVLKAIFHFGSLESRTSADV